MSESLTQAINDMRTMRESYDQLAEVAESTSQAILQEVQNIDIDTTELAKQGRNAAANISDIQFLIGYTIEEINGV